MAESREKTDDNLRRTPAASTKLDHLRNISNLSPSVQKLLQDFAADSDELTKSNSASMLQSLPLLSRDHGVAASDLNNRTRVSTGKKVISPMHATLANKNQTADADGGDNATPRLATVSAFIVDTLPVKANVTQVFDFCDCLSSRDLYGLNVYVAWSYSFSTIVGNNTE